MSGVDAELYLRLCGERMLLDGPANRAFHAPLAEQARALVAVDAIAPDAAQELVDGFARAQALRGRGPGALRHRGKRVKPVTAARPGPNRVAFCDATIEQPWGRLQVRHVLLSPDGLRLAVTMWPDQSAAASSAASKPGPGRRPGPFPGGPPSLTVRDQQGTTVSMGFSGGGDQHKWKGNFHSNQPLALDTAWLEVGGERVELHEPLRGVEVAVRSLAGERPARRYLRHCLEARAERHRDEDAVTAAVQALVGCGVLEADAPEVREALAVASALGHIPGSGWGGVAPGPLPTLPDPWGSLVRRRGFDGGPAGTVRLGVVTEVFDGVRARLCALESSAEGFRVEVGLTGTVVGHHPFHADVARSPVTFAATDDRGNFYLGGLGDWSGSDSEAEGTVEFWPGLDPRADALTITITADRAQAVIRTPLRWAPS